MEGGRDPSTKNIKGWVIRGSSWGMRGLREKWADEGGGGDAVRWTDHTISNSKHIKWKYERVGVGNGGVWGFVQK